MFAAYCPTHASEMLLGYRRLIGLHNTDAGVNIHLLCYCGEHLVVPTGRGRSNRAPRLNVDMSADGAPTSLEPAWADDVGRVAC